MTVAISQLFEDVFHEVPLLVRMRMLPKQRSPPNMRLKLGKANPDLDGHGSIHGLLLYQNCPAADRFYHIIRKQRPLQKGLMAIQKLE